jgi:hypothetical protein
MKDGLPIAALEGGELRRLADSGISDDKLRTLLARRSLRHPLRPYLRAPTAREAALLLRKSGRADVETATTPLARH